MFSFEQCFLCNSLCSPVPQDSVDRTHARAVVRLTYARLHEFLTNLPRENCGVFAFVLFDLGDDLGCGDLGLATSHPTWLLGAIDSLVVL